MGNETHEHNSSEGPGWEMTKEDVPVPQSSEGDTDLGRHSTLSHGGVARPTIHQVASAPMPTDCEFSFFDPEEPQCREVLFESSTTVPELFAVLRQWVPQVQKNISLIGNEILKRGCGVNDRDGLTDMSLLHYCCKAGAPGIGDADMAASFAQQLLSLGAEPGLRSRWTNMSALHYAAYFDVPQLIRVVLHASQPGEVDTTCSDFDFGTALHIAASNLCSSAVKCLLELGANPTFRNERGQCPADVVSEPLDMLLEMADAAALAKELRSLLREALPRPCAPLTLPAQDPSGLSDKARLQLITMGIQLGDRVVIAGQKVGTLQFCGSTEFAGGLWAGVELDQAEGKNDGSVAGVQYFSCRLKYGIFAPLSKISKPSERCKASTQRSATPIRPSQRSNLSRVTSKINTGALSRSLSSSSSSLDSRHGLTVQPRPFPRQRPPRQRRERLQPSSKTMPPPTRSNPSPSLIVPRSRTPSASSSVCDGPEVRLGERVLVVGQRTGVVRFYGKTNFAPGFWLGIELDKPSGKNDGSVGGVNYFSCPPKHGVFAPPSRVQRIHGSMDCLSELSSSRLNRPFARIRRSFSTSTAIAAQKEQSQKSTVNRWPFSHKHSPPHSTCLHFSSLTVFSFLPNPPHHRRSRSNSHRRRWSTLSGGWGPGTGGTGSSGGTTATTTTSSGSDASVRLHLGMQVLLSSANEMALIRYMGQADFAPGLWLGLELRTAKGKNDGQVGGRRYFTCRPDYGVLVRPSRVTYRGINGARLVDENS
ncbi:CAP-Gly domain-containing linker protein 4 isoform X1 [Oncorhynchus tshawytscha]|uniref:CAP-Gly domain-containing linker protein 4 isoform X1 n=2 Tax=Oncorhynchus tshawytscha TaxID=74940 RepID=UPI001C3E3F43|nr:CAP-Gly domain-containing linker protein 4 isoform X1 [Oncorhynchus tshawytscha]